MNVAQNIKRIRESKGMTQEQLAQALGMTHSAISLIESDKRGLNVKKADKIAAALGVTLNDLMREG